LTVSRFTRPVSPFSLHASYRDVSSTNPRPSRSASISGRGLGGDKNRFFFRNIVTLATRESAPRAGWAFILLGPHLDLACARRLRVGSLRPGSARFRRHPGASSSHSLGARSASSPAGPLFFWAHLDLASTHRLPVGSFRPGSARLRRHPGASSSHSLGARSASSPAGPLFFWAHLDLNQGPTDYESAALTN
jgi:hypothetical protein